MTRLLIPSRRLSSGSSPSSYGYACKSSSLPIFRPRHAEALGWRGRYQPQVIFSDRPDACVAALPTLTDPSNSYTYATNLNRERDSLLYSSAL